MTSTDLKSPMSGTRTSCIAPIARLPLWPLLDRERIRLRGIDAVLPDRRRDHRRLDRTVLGERLQRGDRHPVPVDLEEIAELLAGVRAAVAVGAEHAIALAGRQERTDLIRERFHVVGRGDDRAVAAFEAALDVRLARLVLGVQQVPAVGVEAVAAQLREARAATDVGGDVPVLREELGG